MNLVDYTIKVKHYSKNIVNNFLEIGTLLKEIKDKEVFKEKYNCFTDYLDQEQPKLSRSFVLRLIKVVEDPKLCSISNNLGICKTLELIHVTDREKRDEISEKATKENLTTQEIRQEVKKISPEKSPFLNTPEEQFFKLKREFVNFKANIEQINELYDKYLVWKEKATQIGLKLSSEVNILDGLWVKCASRLK